MSESEEKPSTSVQYLFELRKKSMEKYLKSDEIHNDTSTILIRHNYLPKVVIPVNNSKQSKKGYTLRRRTRINYLEGKECSSANCTILDRRDYIKGQTQSNQNRKTANSEI